MITIYVDNTTGEYYRMVEDWNDGSTHRALVSTADAERMVAKALPTGQPPDATARAVSS